MKLLSLILLSIGVLYVICVLLISSASASEIYLTRGDSGSVILQPVKDNIAVGSCWYFPSSGIANPHLYDIAPAKYGNMYVCEIPADLSQEMPEGRYTLIYQIAPIFNNKTFKDVSWKDGSLISILADSKPVKEAGMQSQNIREDLLKKINDNGLNLYGDQQVIIQEPELKIAEIDRIPFVLYDTSSGNKEADEQHISMVPITYWKNYRISGSCNLPNDTEITIKIDEERYFAQHNDSFTFHTRLVRDQSHPTSLWSYDMPLSIDDMPPGWHDVTVYAGRMVTTGRFKINQNIVPTPTPTEIVKYLNNGQIEPWTVTIPVPGPTQYIDRWHTATPTPDITNALGEKIEYPYKTGDQFPAWLPVICLIGILAIVSFLVVRKK